MELRDWLQRCRLIAILRGVKPDEVEAIGAALHAAGIAIVEVPLNSPDPYDSIRRLAARFAGKMLVGAGTVMTAEQAGAVAAAGGELIVMPHTDPRVLRAAKADGMFTCPGFFTPTEAFVALEAGADALKLFPAEATRPAVLKAMRAVLPKETRILPVGGITADNMHPWLAAGAAGFGLGSSIYQPGDTAAIVAAKAGALLAGLKQG